MAQAIEGLEPALVWKYFAEISRVPRGSKNEKAVGQYLVDTAKKLGLKAEQDGVGNVLARKPAAPGCESMPSVCLQGHMDMVCEKNKDTVHDFLKDPIELVRRLSSGEPRTIAAVSQGLGITRQGARKHLQVLADAELVSLEPKGRDVLVRLDPGTLEKAKAFIAEHPSLHYGPKPGWLRFGYPLSYNSDALEALRALAGIGEGLRPPPQVDRRAVDLCQVARVRI